MVSSEQAPLLDPNGSSDGRSSEQGAKIYVPLVLRFYDWWVLGISNTYAWRCPTVDVLLPFFRANFRKRHLDIGVGTGYFPAAAVASEKKNHQKLKKQGRGGRGEQEDDDQEHELTLVDLNPNSLAAAAQRIARPKQTRCIVADALAPLPLSSSLDGSGQGRPEKFDSISLFYLLHCLPGPVSHKTRIFKNLAPHLADDGVLCGATILGNGDGEETGDGARQNWMGTFLMYLYNYMGVFDNWADGRAAFVRALESEFHHVQADRVGAVLLFRAERPRR